jgi:ABC-2 type transport system ATP-binding protein
MWELIRSLRESGVTVILTTHYIQEAEELADRIAVIDNGELLVVEEKTALLQKLGRKQLRLQLSSPLSAIPDSLSEYALTLESDGSELVYAVDHHDDSKVPALLSALSAANVSFTDLETRERSLEDIFVDLLKEGR